MKQTYQLRLTLIAVLILGILALAGCAALDAGQAAALPASTTNNAADDTTTAVVPVSNVSSAPATQVDTPSQVSNNLDLQAAQDTLVSLYERVNPAVVNIQVTINSTDNSNFALPNGANPQDLPNGHPFSGPQYGQGSGFVYSKDGYIVTNNHVVGDADSITVVFADGTEADATLVGTDPDSDLAVIKVDVPADQLTTVALGDSESLKVGQFVIAIGNPFGLDGSMTSGIVSGLGRTLPAEARTISGNQFSIPDIIQTDAAINPGNSGGPLLNLDGDVIGVNTAIATDVGTFSGVGYAVPSETVQQVVPQLIADGQVEHPWIGISGREMNRTLAEAMNLDSNQRGVLVVEVVPDGPSAKAGLQGSNSEVTIDGFPVAIGGDIIVGIDGQPVVEFDNLLSHIVQKTAVGDTITLTVLRNGEQMEIPVTLEARPAQ
ncbi:MAG: trypsin-like peptidase domain-containing protein [Ardenticatenaceae bacterium]|nr:trypsin-like peptidase domain-containing protein [Ardenticatenaceae bacterium]MCB8987957.1 trypsin-like peptidase domain-containing protein [Ardenticatenaceae bacterium]